MGATAWDNRRFVTYYAAAHSHEDWAETFAHYLHIIDLVDTADAHELNDVGHLHDLDSTHSFTVIRHRWRHVGRALDDLADAVGSAWIFPIHPTGAVIDKLELVHARVTAHSD